MRAELWNDARAMIGGSDAGAHLDRMCGAPYPTRFLADCLRGRQLITGRAGRADDDVGAGRACSASATAACSARVRIADIVVFDPETRRQRARRAGHATCPATRRASRPARSGVKRVLVNGAAIVVDGAADRGDTRARCCAVRYATPADR